MLYEFDPVIYPYKLWIIVDKTPDVLSKDFDEYTKNPIQFIDRDTNMFHAFTMPVCRKVNPNYGVVIFFRSKRNISFELVAHEASHAAKYLFDHIGADVNEHEPFEYVVGWIAKCCETVKKSKSDEQNAKM